MTRNKISDLRDHLFATLEALRDEDSPMDIDRAKAIADVSRVIVDSAKVEVAFLGVTGGMNSTGFLPSDDETPMERKLIQGHKGLRVLKSHQSASGKGHPA